MCATARNLTGMQAPAPLSLPRPTYLSAVRCDLGRACGLQSSGGMSDCGHSPRVSKVSTERGQRCRLVLCVVCGNNATSFERLERRILVTITSVRTRLTFLLIKSMIWRYCILRLRGWLWLWLAARRTDWLSGHSHSLTHSPSFTVSLFELR